MAGEKHVCPALPPMLPQFSWYRYTAALCSDRRKYLRACTLRSSSRSSLEDLERLGKIMALRSGVTCATFEGRGFGGGAGGARFCLCDTRRNCRTKDWLSVEPRLKSGSALSCGWAAYLCSGVGVATTAAATDGCSWCSELVRLLLLPLAGLRRSKRLASVLERSCSGGACAGYFCSG